MSSIATVRPFATSGPQKDKYLLGLGILLLIAIATVGISRHASLNWDFANFYDTGRRVAAGQISDIYNEKSLIRGEKPYGPLNYLGTPIAAFLYAPLSYLSPRQALVTFKVVSTLAYAGALLLLFLYYRRFVPAIPSEQIAFAAATVLMAVFYQPFWVVYLVGGQTTPIGLLLFVIALWCYSSGRTAWTIALFTAGVFIKPVFAPALVVLVLMSGWRFTLTAVGVWACFGAVSLLAAGWAIHVEFVRQMLSYAPRVFPWHFNSSMYVVINNARNLSGPGLQFVWSIAAILLKAAAVIAFVRIAMAVRRRPVPYVARQQFTFNLALVLALMLASTLFEHYLTAMFPLFVYLFVVRSELSRQAIVLAVVAFVLAATQNYKVGELVFRQYHPSSAPALLLLGLWKSGPLLVILVLLWTKREELARTLESHRWSVPRYLPART